MLSKDFLEPYRKKADLFPNLLARSTYLGKYCRDGETWTDTIRRCVEGNISLDRYASRFEAEQLFDLFWRGQALPPGRGLWTGGVPGIPVDARYNCHAGVITSIDDWAWCANMLMCGGGVGLSLLKIDQLPTVQGGDNPRLGVLCSHSHPNRGEVMPDPLVPEGCKSVAIEDTRMGWVNALTDVLQAAYDGQSVVFNVSAIRKRGAPIKTFGGISCGPGPLVSLLRNVWAIVRSKVGSKLDSLDCLDITNHIGVCIKSGNVRRSALIVLGKADDQAFRDAKKTYEAIQSHRHSSNNSIVFETQEQIDNFDWNELVTDNLTYGEPGILNLHRIRQSDPLVEGINPCGEIPLEDREACCLSEVYPALCSDVDQAIRLTTRYTIRQRLQPMTDPTADYVRQKNMRIGVGLGGVCDFDWMKADLYGWYAEARAEANTYAKQLGVNAPIKVTTVKPSGTISLLNGSSPGIHSPHAPYYLRRTRISKQEPMAVALMSARVPYEQCAYDSSGNTLVFGFPMKAKHWHGDDDVHAQVERQVRVQRLWADNAVSCTVSFTAEEAPDLAKLLKDNINNLKSISCLPKAHGYEQPPYEAITQSEYERIHSLINHDHPLTVGGELDTMECEGGACPVR
jgi:ribonucleoside-triphosphate reductase